ncbi:MAG: hypothetical protein Q7S07_00100 [Candidatus Omnitrophota bacterium]|nr:hypothetical protein [Candidatus Omnitrophota bacterium]
MAKKFAAVACIVSAFCLILSGVSCAQEKQTVGAKAKSFWQKLFNYPANVTNETAGVITSAVTGATNVATKEVKTVGQVTSGSLEKTKDLVTEPLVGTAETAKKAIEGTVAVPVKANKEEPKQ